MSAPADALPRRPFWKDPFVLMFVVGIVLVTLAAPRFRKIAPPPEVTGQLPQVSLLDATGTTLTPAAFAGRVTLVGLVTDARPEASRSLVAALAELQPRFRVARAEVAYVLIDLDAPAGLARPGWVPDDPASGTTASDIAATGSGASHDATSEEAAHAAAARGWTVVAGPGACEAAVALFETVPPGTPCERAVRAADDARVALIDASGQVRGIHGTSMASLYETFERTLRACDLARGGS